MKGLKLLNKIYMIWLVGLTAIMLSACEVMDINIPDWAENSDIVTVVPFAEGDSCFYIHRGDTLFDPRRSNSFGDREVRAYLYYTKISSYHSSYFNSEITEIDVLSVDSIITLKVEPNLGAALNDGTYGKEPIELYHEDYYNYDCYTHIADGYLNLHLAMPVGDSGCLHDVSLIPFIPEGGDTPDENRFELRHKMIGNSTPYDPATSIFGEVVIAFDIKHLDKHANNGRVTIILDNELTSESIDLRFDTQPIHAPYSTKGRSTLPPIDPETIF